MDEKEWSLMSNNEKLDWLHKESTEWLMESIEISWA